MKALFKVLLVFLGVLGWWSVWQENEITESNKFSIHYQGLDGKEANNDGFLMNVEGNQYLIKRPFTGGSAHSTQYTKSEQRYWLNDRLIEGRDLKKEGHDDTNIYVFEAIVVFQLEVTRLVGKWDEQSDEYIPRSDYDQVESEFPALKKYLGEYGSHYYVDNKNMKYKNKHFIVSCSIKMKDLSGIKPCRFNVGIDDYINVRIMLYPDRLADWDKLMSEINTVLSAISYVGNKSDIKKKL